MAFDADSHAALGALLDHARKAGAGSAEASFSARESVSAEVRCGELEGMEREESRSVALRAFIGKQQAAASSTDLSSAGLKALAERVVAMAKAAPEDPYCGLLDAKYRASGPFEDLEQADTARPSAEQLRDMALACEAATFVSPEISREKSGGAGASSDYNFFVYATSDGFEGSDASTTYSLGAQPIAERDGKMERDYEYRTKRFLADLPDAAAIGRTAGERALARLGPRKLESSRAPVIFANRRAGSLLSPLIGGISGNSIARGTSFLKNKLGQRVFAPGFELKEDPFIKRAIGSMAFDGEGCAVKRNLLVDDGVITMWLLNSATARQLKLEPTGHATSGHGGPPGIAAANLAVKPGKDDLAGLMKNAGKGLYVTEMFSPALNMNTGDWSVGVSGFWFEHGEIAYPVSEVTVAGALLDIYARMIPGADLDNRGALEIPSMLIDDLAIGGV
ncbi:MAG: TldD/PmbA family protein [Hyphomonadaceae bacterium]|nr:TldD/PmbA family protein [Hyphomonadaceae bacterium]